MITMYGYFGVREGDRIIPKSQLVRCTENRIGSRCYELVGYPSALWCPVDVAPEFHRCDIADDVRRRNTMPDEAIPC